MELLEIELKFPAGTSDVRPRLIAWGARPMGVHRESDEYWNAPDRDFAQTNEALRIRTTPDDARITYKGRRQPGPAKTRKEIEVQFATVSESEPMARLLESLGYRRVATVTKVREMWQFQRGEFNITVCLDDVQSVGRFIEVEILAPEADKTQAQSVLEDVCRDLQLSTPEQRSYLRMLLESAAPPTAIPPQAS